MSSLQIEGYEILEEAGRGDVATVYVARQQPVGRYVAVKFFDHLLPDSTERLRQLFEKLEQLDHTNILPVYDRGTSGDRSYWVMRYMPARSLAARQRGQRLTVEEIDRFVAQVASALDYACQHDLIHGDLKPANILLDHAGNAFVSDFGLFEILGGSLSDYQPLEQRRDSIPDARSDVYAFSAIVYELLTGRLPIDPRARAEPGVNRRIPPPVKPSEVNPRVTGAIDQVILKALATDPDQRYQSAQEFSEAYAQARAAEPVEATKPEARKAAIAPIERGDVVVRHNRVWRWITAGVFGVLIVLGAIALLTSRVSQQAAPPPTATLAPLPSATALPASIPTVPPTATSSPAPSPSVTPSPSPLPPASSTPTLTPTATKLRTAPVTPRVLTATPAIKIDPLVLLAPRSEDRASLSLSFRTHVRPDDISPIGMLWMSVPSIEPLVIDRGLAQVGAGEQVMSVSILIDCGLVPGPITTQQIELTIRDNQGIAILSQMMDYTKTWCR